ncbi:MerR family transcriptional regulator [Fusibacter sp. Q10-2]|uniref:MerR family transcriptional regulator n=2 Tax=Fusibacter ferrireducens TaxID=2785058 RepID=A0ABS0A055_9FIRM|nr:helix-turn-helix domain-containing protein [Fusibacter ferrireducens]MBF4695254.1 MerR family transcriptional regulator [Fusibacter ferrireducens]
MEKLTIGQMARLNQVSEQTLRYYDKIKLLMPDTVDETNGYRYYSIGQSAYLDMIQYMKSLGMRLSDIKKQLELKDPSMIKSVLRKKSDQINTEIRALKQQQRAIERTLQCYQHYETSPPDGTIILEYIPERIIYCIDANINFYDYGIDVYEKMLRKLKESLISDNLPQIYFCNAGTILRQKKLQQHEFYSSEVFVVVDREFVADQLTSSIPENAYLCIYCDEFEKEKAYITRLLNKVEEEGYRIVGDYICEVIAEFPLLESKKRGMFFKLQIPIKFN